MDTPPFRAQRIKDFQQPLCEFSKLRDAKSRKVIPQADRPRPAIEFENCLSTTADQVDIRGSVVIRVDRGAHTVASINCARAGYYKPQSQAIGLYWEGV